MQSTGIQTRVDRSACRAATSSSHVRRAKTEVWASAAVPGRNRLPAARPDPSRLAQTLKVHYAQSSVDIPLKGSRVETVGEVMTAGTIHTVFPDTPVIEALELLVEKHVTGLPVINKEHQVVGVVSDFDLLAIDLPEDPRHNIFPSIDQSWEVFHDLQNVISKSEGKLVEDVMTDDPIVVRAETSIHSAARLLLETRTRRLPVVDAEGSLIGLLTRRDIVTAALASRREHPEKFEHGGEVMFS